MTVRIAIDLNVRVGKSSTYAGLEDADGPVREGDTVTAYEAETGVQADAAVTAVDREKGLVYLRVDWASFREDPGADDDPACE